MSVSSECNDLEVKEPKIEENKKTLNHTAKSPFLLSFVIFIFLNMFEPLFILLAGFLLYPAVLVISMILFAPVKVAILLAYIANYFRYYISYSDFFGNLMSISASALGLQKDEVGGFFFLMLILALLLYGSAKIFVILFPSSTRWVNIGNLFRNTFILLFLVSSGFELLKQVSYTRTYLQELLVSSLEQSVAHAGFPSLPIDLPAACKYGLGLPCQPELDCAGDVIGCHSRSMADTLGGIAGIKALKEAASQFVPPDYLALFSLNSPYAILTNWSSLDDIVKKWSEGIALLLIALTFVPASIMESLTYLIIELTFVVIYIFIPVGVVLSFFGITENYLPSLIQKGVGLFISSILLISFISFLQSLLYAFAGNAGILVGGTLLWFSSFNILLRFFLSTLVSGFDGVTQSTGIGGISGEVSRAGQSVLGALRTAAGLALFAGGGAGLGASALLGALQTAQKESGNYSVASKLGIARNITGLITGAALGQTPMGRTIVSASRLLNNTPGLPSTRTALKYASFSDSLSLGSQIGGNLARGNFDNVVESVFMNRQLRTGAMKNIFSEASSGNAEAIQDAERLNYERMTSVPGYQSSNVIKRIQEGKTITLESEKVLKPVSGGLKSIHNLVHQASEARLINENGEINLSTIAAQAKTEFKTPAGAQMWIQKTGKVIGQQSAQAALELASLNLGKDEDGTPVTALDYFTAAYERTFRAYQERGENPYAAMKDSRGLFSERAPFFVELRSQIERAGGPDLYANPALARSAMTLARGIAQRVDTVSGYELLVYSQRAAEEGVSPIAYVQDKTGLSNVSLETGAARVITHLAQNPEPSSAHIVKAIARQSPENIERLTSFARKMQSYLDTGVKNNDREVISFLNPESEFAHIQSANRLLKKMKESNLFTREELAVFQNIHIKAAEYSGFAPSETTIWQTMEAIRSIPADVKALVMAEHEPKSPPKPGSLARIPEASIPIPTDKTISFLQEESNDSVESLKQKLLELIAENLAEEHLAKRMGLSVPALSFDARLLEEDTGKNPDYREKLEQEYERQKQYRQMLEAEISRYRRIQQAEQNRLLELKEEFDSLSEQMRNLAALPPDRPADGMTDKEKIADYEQKIQMMKNFLSAIQTKEENKSSDLDFLFSD